MNPLIELFYRRGIYPIGAFGDCVGILGYGCDCKECKEADIAMNEYHAVIDGATSPAAQTSS